MTRPPYSFCTGSQTVLVKNESPYLLIAGQALMVSEVRMASNKARVSRAEPLASQPKIRSARGPERARLTGGGWVMAREGLMADKLDGESPCTSVEDMGLFSVSSVAAVDYLKATGLPAPSLISHQDFWMAAITEGGMGT